MTFKENSFICLAEENLYKMHICKNAVISLLLYPPQDSHCLDPKAMKCFISENKIPAPNL